MIQLPIWVWVVSVLGVIAAGVGLGYLLIYLFWRIERYFNPSVAVRENQPPEAKEEMIIREDGPVIVAQEIEEIIPRGNRLIRFADVLHSQFNHSFKAVTTIVCWDIGLKHGEKVRDTKGNQMKLQIIEPKNPTERTRYLLIDKTGHQTISVVPGREYIKQETKFDLDKVKMV
ncbi:hypothetical protein ACFLYI_00560 [Chloroflexota bacterium]